MHRPRSSALRKGRHWQPGQVYLVTFTTRDRIPYFADRSAAINVSDCLASPQAWADSQLLCWVLMPDHWHGLIALGECETLSRNVGRAKALASRACKADRPNAPALWAQGFHDRALRHDEDLLETARYIIANPIRAGLVRKAGDYPFWDAIWLNIR